jgi:hypothetical protein
MTVKIVRSLPGKYEARFYKGFRGIIENTENGWIWSIWDTSDQVVELGVQATLKKAKNEMLYKANGITVTSHNAMSGKPIEVSITACSATDPSTETYWSM